ncbi:AzlD domain-containing protein [Salarchaeum sp. III]|uniref:AzlD domain-containing protein n=1 Tax=Salarchaeum sp. III TaxID=3107927 RepID=UPI002ED861FD
MNDLTLWALVLVIGAATFLIRYSFIYLVGHTGDLPPRLSRALAFVPPAVFAALVVPEFVSYDGVLQVAPDQLTAGVAAALVAWYTENMFATIAAGMLALWALRFLV